VEQLLGRGPSARHDIAERLEMARLVAAVAVEALAPLETVLRDREALLRDIEQRATEDGRLKSAPGHVVAQFLALLRAPVLDEIPPGAKAVVVIEQADPERRQRRQATPRSTVRAAHLEIALEADLGKDRRDVVRPVRDGGPLARQLGELAGHQIAERF